MEDQIRDLLNWFSSVCMKNFQRKYIDGLRGSFRSLTIFWWSKNLCYYQGEIEKLLQNGEKAECVGNTRYLLGFLLLLLCPVIKVNGKLQPNPVRRTNDPGPSEIKIWVTLPGKEPWPPEVITGWRPREYGMGSGRNSYEYQLQPHDQLQKWGL